jgi:A/G-specific adenine glycosylase
VRGALLAWFDRSARDLPWRRDPSPYRVWLSEVMLQQTRVDTVIPYFERFVRDFPDVRALAAASVDDVLARWSGLGYYRRARQLHAAADAIVERFGGELPSTVEELRSLPGVGAYTAGAVASIAHGRPVPLVDGNVARVIARLAGLREAFDTAAGARATWAIAARLVPSDRPGDFNQSLMELGSLVCTPTSPLCLTCPVRAACTAAREGLQEVLPLARKRAAVRELVWTALVAVRGRRVLLARRPLDGLFGGLWEPPMVDATTLDTLVRDGVEVDPASAGSFEHVLSHRRLSIDVRRANFARKLPAIAPYEALAWHTLGERELGLSTLARKTLAAAGVESKALRPAAERAAQRRTATCS